MIPKGESSQRRRLVFYWRHSKPRKVGYRLGTEWDCSGLIQSNPGIGAVLTPLRFVPFDEPHGPNFDGLSFLEESVVQTRVFTPLPGDRNPPILLPSVWALIGWSVLQK